jgi:surface polysaccharide O-acyltransferase-like enzyme
MYWKATKAKVIVSLILAVLVCIIVLSLFTSCNLRGGGSQCNYPYIELILGFVVTFVISYLVWSILQRNK